MLPTRTFLNMPLSLNKKWNLHGTLSLILIWGTLIKQYIQIYLLKSGKMAHQNEIEIEMVPLQNESNTEQKSGSETKWVVAQIIHSFIKQWSNILKSSSSCVKRVWKRISLSTSYLTLMVCIKVTILVTTILLLPFWDLGSDYAAAHDHFK